MPRQPRNWGPHLLLAGTLASVIGFSFWAATGRLDVVSLASGEVVPASGVKPVQHLEGGIVAAILVREGDSVGKDQPLIELEPTRSGADLEELDLRVASLEAKEQRLKAEAAGQTKLAYSRSFANRKAALVRAEIALFNSRLKRVENQLDVHREQIIQREQEVFEIEARFANNQTALELLDEQLTISAKLLKLDLTNRMGHLALLREQTALKGALATDQVLLPRARAAQNEAKAQLAAIRSAFSEDALSQLNEVRRDKAELTQRRRKLADSLRRMVLRAPVAGTIKTLNILTTGAVVQAGRTVAEIVPAGDRLVIEARLPTADIGYVHVDQAVRVQLASADAARLGWLDGRVTRISPDALATREGDSFYRVRIETDRDYFEHKGLTYQLYPGMRVQCSILTGSRTVWQYLVDPYYNTLKQALRER